MRLLLIAGADEARHIALALWREPGFSVTVSVSRAGMRPESFGWPVRIGGWNDDAAFGHWIETEGFDAMIDASHPFATDMSARAARVAKSLGIDHIRFLRPAWVPDTSDRWVFLNSEDEAHEHIPLDTNVFASVGRSDLGPLRNLDGRRLYFRVTEWPVGRFPLEGGDFLFSPGPYTVTSERRLLNRLGIHWIVARNTGGAGSWPKIEAARDLGIRVALVRRPPPPDGPRATTVAETLAWVRRRM
ncbi:precorrin-6A/cobalt-precorrin-6A reductase [Silicimonas sp. MF1-12-2]|uniref:precorrin-6A/cobalt-precorrin-6A reductase n=1 Tax=Silicimonas sp. MF1-12-2 TaxID=3384793 RepID=UPI0039B5DA48